MSEWAYVAMAAITFAALYFGMRELRRGAEINLQAWELVERILDRDREEAADPSPTLSPKEKSNV